MDILPHPKVLQPRRRGWKPRQRRHPTGRVLVVIPVYGEQDTTHALLDDLRREPEHADVVVVDNRGDYEAAGHEAVLRPGSNLGWAGGTNYGTREAGRDDHAAFVWLNNDTRLSHGFVAGLLRSWEDTAADVVGPVYDCHWRHQRLVPPVPVGSFRPRALTYRAPFIDGTCMFVPAATVDALGLLDADTFAPLGWGAEIDYCLRARAAGLTVAVTRQAYLHHERAVTAQAVFGDFDSYHAAALSPALSALQARWRDWERLAEVDLPASQTRPLRRSDRIGRPRRTV